MGDTRREWRYGRGPLSGLRLRGGILLLSRYNRRFFGKDISQNSQKIEDIGLLQNSISQNPVERCLVQSHLHPRTLPTPPSMDDIPFLVDQHVDQA